jgi:hypothetical protein
MTIKAVVFDAYGTLFDVYAVTAAVGTYLSPLILNIQISGEFSFSYFLVLFVHLFSTRHVYFLLMSLFSLNYLNFML